MSYLKNLQVKKWVPQFPCCSQPHLGQRLRNQVSCSYREVPESHHLLQHQQKHYLLLMCCSLPVNQ